MLSLNLSHILSQKLEFVVYLPFLRLFYCFLKLQLKLVHFFSNSQSLLIVVTVFANESVETKLLNGVKKSCWMTNSYDSELRILRVEPFNDVVDSYIGRSASHHLGLL